MTSAPVVLIRSVTVHASPSPDRLTRWLLVVVAFSLAWLALRPHVVPPVAEAGREAVQVNIERVGGRYLTNGVIPVRCEGR